MVTNLLKIKNLTKSTISLKTVVLLPKETKELSDFEFQRNKDLLFDMEQKRYINISFKKDNVTPKVEQEVTSSTSTKRGRKSKSNKGDK